MTVVNGGNIVNFQQKNLYLVTINVMKIIYTIMGLVLIFIAFVMLYHLPKCKDDTDLALCIFEMICSSFGGICIIVDTIKDWNKSK